MKDAGAGTRDEIGDILARELYLRAGYSERAAAGAARIALAILGDGCIAPAICVPKLAFLAAHAQRGDDWKGLAAEFQVSESMMALRSAECLGTPTALVTPSVVRTRGRPWEWPSERADWVKLMGPVRARANGLIVSTLSDARDRVVLRAN